MDAGGDGDPDVEFDLHENKNINDFNNLNQ